MRLLLFQFALTQLRVQPCWLYFTNIFIVYSFYVKRLLCKSIIISVSCIRLSFFSCLSVFCLYISLSDNNFFVWLIVFWSVCRFLALSITSLQWTVCPCSSGEGIYFLSNFRAEFLNSVRKSSNRLEKPCI